MEILQETNAHKIVRGREFGEIKYPKNFLEAEKFNQAAYYRWLTRKNKDFAAAYRGSNLDESFPLS